MNSRRLQRRGAKVSKTLQSRLVPRTTPARLLPRPYLLLGNSRVFRTLYGMELGSVTLKRIGFFCFPIKHSTHL